MGSTITYIAPLKTPRVDPQLGISTGSRDCAFRATQGGIRYLTGREVPISTLRSAIGVPNAGIGPIQVQELFTKYGVSSRFSRDLTEFRSALANGYYVVAMINYRYLNANHPKLSGDPDFRGTAGSPALHSIGVYGLEQRGKGQWTEDLDPLHDGRRSAIPKQIVMSRRGWIEDCMQAMPSGVQFVIARG
jgi:hypothetical protein